MQNETLKQSWTETNFYTFYIIRIHLAKHRHVINKLIDVLKSINDTAYNKSLAIDGLSYARSFLLTLAEIDHKPIM